MQVYFDNNANTPICNESREEILKWMCICGNPSSDNLMGIKSQNLIANFKAYLSQKTKAENIIITSSASEANSQAIATYAPYGHIVVSAIEHDSIRNGIKYWDNYTEVLPRIDGKIHPADVAEACRSDTVAVFVMHANNETGIMNNINEMIQILDPHIAIHIDIVQSFGKCCPQFLRHTVRPISTAVSFHKLYGPIGVGVLMGNRQFSPVPIIFGNQNNGFRGGTYNIAGIAGAFTAMKVNFRERIAKNNHLRDLRSTLFRTLSPFFNIITIREYLTSETLQHKIAGTVVKFAEDDNTCLPNTASMIIIPAKNKLCNTRLRKSLMGRGFIISISSACNTKNKTASHVLQSIVGDDTVAKTGFIRISFSDYNTCDQSTNFAKCIISSIASGKCWQ